MIALSDVEYWSQYYHVFSSANDVYSLISAQDGMSVVMPFPLPHPKG